MLHADNPIILKINQAQKEELMKCMENKIRLFSLPVVNGFSMDFLGAYVEDISEKIDVRDKTIDDLDLNVRFALDLSDFEEEKRFVVGRSRGIVKINGEYYKISVS
jgi:tricorn protease-like protein